jgi:hypothetical protein
MAIMGKKLTYIFFILWAVVILAVYLLNLLCRGHICLKLPL